jgi:hypothetical protein
MSEFNPYPGLDPPPKIYERATIVFITTPRFCGGVFVKSPFKGSGVDNEVPPCFNFMKQWSIGGITRHCKQRGWLYEVSVEPSGMRTSRAP